MILFLAASITVCRAAPGEEDPLKEVSLVTLWLPQAQFAGYYVALEKGFYKKHGLDVTIINGGPDNPPFKLLENGKVDFAVMWLSTAIEKRASGIKLVNIGQVLQRSGLMLIAKRSSGIYKPKDMNHKKVGLWDADFEIQPRAFFKKFDLNVTVIPQSYTVNLFLQGGVDVVSAMWYNEYHTILNSGYDPEDLTTFFFYDYGLNAPEDGIYTLEDTVTNEPGTCRAFASASLEGWIYAFTHIDEAVAIVLNYMTASHVPATLRHQKWQLERMRDLSLVDGSLKEFGRLTEADFAGVAQGLKETELIKDIPQFSAFHKDYRIHDKD